MDLRYYCRHFSLFSANEEAINIDQHIIGEIKEKIIFGKDERT